MNDRPRGDGEPADGTPDYHWLYGGGADPTSGTPREPRPDETRVMPAMSRPTDPNAGQGGPAGPVGAAPRRAGSPPTPPPLAPTPGQRPPRRRGFRFYLRIVLALLLLWVAYLVVVPFYAWSKVDKVAFEPKVGRPAEQPGTTYLMVGSDSRAGLTKEQRKEYATGNAAGQRTDTIMLLHTGSGPNLLMSIPRDSIVDIPGHGTGKINAAYAYGGAKLLVKTIEQETGIRVDQYAEVGLGGVVSMVDAVGGIEICPTFRMKDRLAGLNIKKGCQQVDGRVALAYARSRHTDPRYGDITRAKHQREVVSAVGSEVLSPATFINPFRYWDVMMATPDTFTFGEGMSTIDAGRWALAMTRVNGDKGLTCGVPISDLAVHWDPVRSKRMFRYIKQDKTDDMPKSLCTPTGLPRSVTG
ncbi:LCP family protein [Nocardioides sp. URHA0020]|uniref:LCP family protein n=1 Tax=Nocardioides sp. URHA0020 TaxID=1380392 RepID=UPI0004910C86|nr:LCP family protein [Nocardioides sp. URHA0020]